MRSDSVVPRVQFGGPGALVPGSVVTTLVSYDSRLFTAFLMLSPNWHTSTLQAIDDHCNALENQFVQTYHQHLYFKHAFSSSMPIEFCR